MIRLPSGNALHVAYLRAAGGREPVGQNASNKNPHDSSSRMHLKTMQGDPCSNEKTCAAMS